MIDRKNLFTLIFGIITGTVLTILILVLSNNAPFLKAASVNSGAQDINARYLDGYGTQTSTSSSKIYVSDGSGYLPDGSIDTGAIVDGTIMNADINASAAIDSSKFSGIRTLTAEASSDITVTTSMCSSAPCGDSVDTCTKICTSQGYVSCDHYHLSSCQSPGWSAPKSWGNGSWSSGTICAFSDGSWSGSSRITGVTCYR